MNMKGKGSDSIFPFSFFIPYMKGILCLRKNRKSQSKMLRGEETQL